MAVPLHRLREIEEAPFEETLFAPIEETEPTTAQHIRERYEIMQSISERMRGVPTGQWNRRPDVGVKNADFETYGVPYRKAAREAKEYFKDAAPRAQIVYGSLSEDRQSDFRDALKEAFENAPGGWDQMEFWRFYTDITGIEQPAYYRKEVPFTNGRSLRAAIALETLEEIAGITL